jgi:hypothetical protein
MDNSENSKNTCGMWVKKLNICAIKVSTKSVKVSTELSYLWDMLRKATINNIQGHIYDGTYYWLKFK